MKLAAFKILIWWLILLGVFLVGDKKNYTTNIEKTESIKAASTITEAETFVEAETKENMEETSEKVAGDVLEEKNVLVESDAKPETETTDSVTEELSAKEDNFEYFRELTLIVGTKGSLDKSLKKGSYTSIYEYPDDTSYEIGKLEYNCAVFAKPENEQFEDDYYYVDVMGRGSGYVKREESEQCKIRIGSDDKIRAGIVMRAMDYLGLSFVRYGKSLETGIDCSNFIKAIYQQFDMKIPAKPKKQYTFGKVVEESEMQPGDIIYYDRANDNSGHVGLYIGDGFIINSSGHSGKNYPEGGVRIVRLLYPDRDHYYVVNMIDSDKMKKQLAGDNNEE